jgi:hypothetical protein
VAAHLEPEILVVDEVLAVGDASFQKKCLGKMEDVAEREGRTVLFVSHQMTAINKLTSTCLYLDSGLVRVFGATSEVVADYMSGEYSESKGLPSFLKSINSRGDKKSYIASVKVQTSSEGVIHEASKPLAILFEVLLDSPRSGRTISLQLVNQYGWPVTHLWIYDEDNCCLRGDGLVKLKCKIPSPRLNIGSYVLNVYLGGRPNEPLADSALEVCRFQIVNTLESTLYGWRESACCYHEDSLWMENGVEVKPILSVLTK